jgi:hypothetical protein
MKSSTSTSDALDLRGQLLAAWRAYARSAWRYFRHHGNRRHVTTTAMSPAALRLAVLAALLMPQARAAETQQRTVTVTMASPLTTIVRLSGAPPRARIIEAEIIVPDDAPADLGVGAFVADRHESWFQRYDPQRLRRGRNHVRLSLTAHDFLASEPLNDVWDPHAAATANSVGLFFWSTARCGPLSVTYHIASAEPLSSSAHRLLDIACDGAGETTLSAATGERWQMRFRPQPFPENPFDPAEFMVDALIALPDGSEVIVPAFFDQPMTSSERGDREDVLPSGGGHFCVRFRPRQPGIHHLRLRARWRGAVEQDVLLPDMSVAGKPWDDYVRVDARDPRFFSVGDKWHWPIGVNMHAISDLRCQQMTQSKITRDRGTLSYDAYFRRFARAQCDFVEIWMAAWNVGLEWRSDWYGYRGIGRYNLANAWRLDRILDMAWANGIRVNLVVNNHGQASIDHDREWELNPFNRANGGPFANAQMLFTDSRSLSAQDNHRRYIIGRYSDHPAIFGWKLWSEFDLTEAKSAGPQWYRNATARWKESDIYHHPIGSHWSGDYERAQREIVSQPGIDYNCIDAYHGDGRLVVELISESLLHERKGLAQYGKPTIVTEFGGYWRGALTDLLKSEHPSGGWAGLVSGHGGMPMLWWCEWVDQHEAWEPYSALARFIAGEDLRGKDANSVSLSATSLAGRLWARAWCRRGRMLGYLVDVAWGLTGSSSAQYKGVQLTIGTGIPEGDMRIEWWDADKGDVIESGNHVHPGGAMVLTPPAFRHHLAFKMWRVAP